MEMIYKGYGVSMKVDTCYQIWRPPVNCCVCAFILVLVEIQKIKVYSDTVVAR